MFVVGATLGESIVPVCIGLVIEWVGASSMPLIIMMGVFSITAIYLIAHSYSLKIIMESCSATDAKSASISTAALASEAAHISGIEMVSSERLLAEEAVTSPLDGEVTGV